MTLLVYSLFRLREAAERESDLWRVGHIGSCRGNDSSKPLFMTISEEKMVCCDEVFFCVYKTRLFICFLPCRGKQGGIGRCRCVSQEKLFGDGGTPLPWIILTYRG